MKILVVDKMKAGKLSWTDGDGKDGDVEHGIDYTAGEDLPSWAEPLLTECDDKPGQYEPIEVHSGKKHLVLFPRAITHTMILEEQSRRPAKLFCIPVETLARFTRNQRLWVGERSIETEASGTIGLVIDLALLSTDELHTLDSFYVWIEAHKHEEKRYNRGQNDLPIG